jgi:plastocyanin
MAVGQDVWKESDGKSVTVTAMYDVLGNNQVVYIDGWLGLAADEAESGDMVALTIDRQEFQFEVPSGLTVNNGDIVYIEVADLTGHAPDSTAYSTSSGAGKQALFKATSDKDENNVVTGILLSGMI